jgi:hypothetical protein
LKPLRRERAAYFDPAIFRFVDVENESRGGELDQAKPEVPSVPVGLVCLDIATAAIVVLELALNECNRNRSPLRYCARRVNREIRIRANPRFVNLRPKPNASTKKLPIPNIKSTRPNNTVPKNALSSSIAGSDKPNSLGAASRAG